MERKLQGFHIRALDQHFLSCTNERWLNQLAGRGGECPSAGAPNTSEIHNGRAENLSSQELSQSKHLPIFFHTALQMLLFSEALFFSLWRTLLIFILTWFHHVTFFPRSQGKVKRSWKETRAILHLLPCQMWILELPCLANCTFKHVNSSLCHQGTMYYTNASLTGKR